MAINLDCNLRFDSELAQISAILFSRHCHRAFFLNFAPPRRAPPFLVRASGAVALKMAQVPSTMHGTTALESRAQHLIQATNKGTRNSRCIHKAAAFNFASEQ